MVLNRLRSLLERPLMRIARRIPLTPSMLSWLGLLLAAGAGFCFYQGYRYLLLAGAVLLLFSGCCDALDGVVARLGQPTLLGDFLDHTLDRYADVFVLVGISLSPWCALWVGLLAIVGVLLTSYAGTQAQAVGLGRHYGGLGRGDRLALLVVIPIIQYGLMSRGIFTSLMEWMMIFFAIACNATAVLRFVATWLALRRG